MATLLLCLLICAALAAGAFVFQWLRRRDDAPLNLTLTMRLEPETQESVAAFIHRRLEEEKLGRLSLEEGSGYMTAGDGEITGCDFDIFSGRPDRKKVAAIQKNLNGIAFLPKGSYLRWRNGKYPVGSAAMLAVYLTVHCPDIDALIAKLCDALHDRGLCFFSSYSGETKTALYFYGRDCGEMRRTVSEILQSEGLAQDCRLEQLA